MDVYKDFIQHLRKMSFDEVHTMLCNIEPKLAEYVFLLTQVKFEDGSYHTYYGDVKRIISSFINYFSYTVDYVTKEADKRSNVITKDELLGLIDQTVSIYQSNQLDFRNDFLPISSPSEKLIYEELEVQYKDYLKQLDKLRAKIDSILKQDQINEFVKDHFEIAVKKTSEMFNYAHTYLTMMLVDRISKTRTSLEEITFRLTNNLRRVEQESEKALGDLMDKLYDKNKESLTVCRADRKRSLDLAEVGRSIQIIRSKIETFETEVPLYRLEEEVMFWQRRMKEFEEVAVNIVKIKAEQENLAKQEQIYNTMRSTELPGSKHACWEAMGFTYKEQQEYLKQKLIEESKAMLTFYACKGTDRILYMDNIGPYYIDEFNHQVYVFDCGLNVYHVNCEGKFREVPINLYYFDNYGRYIIQDGKKLYQCAPCTSLYKLEDDDLLTKEEGLNKVQSRMAEITAQDMQCRRPIKDPNDVIILPDLEPMDITKSLDHETVTYLWDKFGSLLPEALHDVGMAKSKNPIHYLAHKILYHKYNKTLKQLRQKTAEAGAYRANIYKERKEKAIASSKAWKAKQMKRSKPEELDDSQERAVFDAHVAQHVFINSLNFYNV